MILRRLVKDEWVSLIHAFLPFHSSSLYSTVDLHHSKPAILLSSVVYLSIKDVRFLGLCCWSKDTTYLILLFDLSKTLRSSICLSQRETGVDPFYLLSSSQISLIRRILQHFCWRLSSTSNSLKKISLPFAFTAWKDSFLLESWGERETKKAREKSRTTESY